MKPRSKSIDTSKTSGRKKSRASYGQEPAAAPVKMEAEVPVREAVTAGPGALEQKPQSAPARSSALSHQEISERARSLWEREGRPEGRDSEIWLRAEAELKSERG
jgi:hypothetical protein